MEKTAAVLIAAICLAGCSSSRNGFTEENWRRETAATRVGDLHAPHFRNGEFFNPWMPMKNKSILSVFEWKMSRSDRVFTGEERAFMPAVIPDASGRIRALGTRDFILWVGHNTFLIRIGGQWWLTDPVFSERVLLPRRKTPPGIGIDDLVKIAPRLNVTISHNHYDHLDEPSILKLPADTRYYVPMGLKDYFIRLGRKNVVELDWWREADSGNGTRVVCLPSQHWSRRIGQAFNTTLWGSFLLVTPGVTVYMGGDSGYFKGYGEFGRIFPRIDYALLPVTAYHPRWFMYYAHMNITEALAAFRDLGARVFILAHWGTFQLGDEPPGYPALDLKRQAAASGIDPGRIMIMDIGSIMPLKGRKLGGTEQVPYKRNTSGTQVL